MSVRLQSHSVSDTGNRELTVFYLKSQTISLLVYRYPMLTWLACPRLAARQMIRPRGS